MTQQEFERRLTELLREYESTNDVDPGGPAGCFYAPVTATMETPWFEWTGEKFVPAKGHKTLDP